MPDIMLIAREEFDRVRGARIDSPAKQAILADMCRANTLAVVKRAGSGHLGSSFSSLDVVAHLYFSRLNIEEAGWESPGRDIYFSSKGHDVPGQYAVLYALGVVPGQRFLDLRRLGGVTGHPDICIPGIEANSGSLGMGISKAKGMAWAKRRGGHGGRVYVLLGDGELQEGQIYEGLQSAARLGLDNLIAIVDHNKVQSDKLVDEIGGPGDLVERFAAFGWEAARCDGHDFAALEEALSGLEAVSGRPKILVADTIKGRGVSFMEHPRAMSEGGGLYRWHAGAPDDESFEAGYAEIVERVNLALSAWGLGPLDLRKVPPLNLAPSGVSAEYVAWDFGQALVELAGEHPELVVLDADLAADCKIRDFELTHPERFIELGIAEQDMVSTAGGLALSGLLPVVNSFASFLASRANEQIYVGSTEHGKVIYACHYAGLIPAGPGHSHQSLRDISLFAALPDMTIIQPSCGAEARMAVGWCVEQAQGSCMLRLNIGPSPRVIELPRGYAFKPGCGAMLAEGKDALLFAYGPVMLHEALVAHEILAREGFGLEVVNLPWLNRADRHWLDETIKPFKRVLVLEDHAPVGGLGDFLLAELNRSGLIQGREFSVFGVEGIPACGTPPEALKAHGLDGASLAKRVKA